MNQLTSWWHRASPCARARAAERARNDAQGALLIVEADLRAERERTQHLTRITRRDQADLESLAEHLGRAWDARDSARRVAVTLDNENRCAIDLLRLAADTLAKVATDPPDSYTRQDQDLHYWIGAFLRTQGTVPLEDTAKAAG
mgnify:CR=1 FL=1